jgi:tetratricopeptide (TPR) repeat protein
MANYSETMMSPAKRTTRGIFRRLIVAGLVPGVCLSMAGSSWAAAGAGAGAASGGGVTAYQRAVDSFNREDYAAAAALLDKIPDNGNPRDRADVLNLRGAIYLHEHQFEKARAFFSRARILDPGLWAASFNAAEANFQAKDYAESRRQFSDLLANTPQASHPQEWALVQYKMLLAGALGGNEKPLHSFLAEHAKDAQPPAAYYFLQSAVEYRQSHQREAAQWLARATAIYPAASEQVYAETFAQLGWPTPHEERAAVLAEANGAGAPMKAAAPFTAMDAQEASAQKLSPATLAVVQLIPGQPSASKAPAARQPAVDSIEKPAFRYGGPMAIPLPPEQPTVQNAPPGPAADAKSGPGLEGGMMIGALPEAPVLARHRSSPSPSPESPASSPDAASASASPTGSASPAAADASAASPSASASPSPGASPAASPDASASPGSSAAPAQPAFVQKYEAAYVKFIQKDYDGARVLLDQADAIQPNQPSAISLRGQIFKHYYEAAYVDYLKADYPGAMAQLDEADIVQLNQPDASNLRGLVYSRQHNYEQAEGMFKKAIQTDPTFWAAKFNLAELPFNYRNYTAARSRFEDLFSETDPVKQPREAELTQFKVFLTLLLEGKEPAARSFMEHFTFSGTTPARYFCQSALDFYHGDVDKAMGWLDSAKKEYPAQLVSIFIESFYRVGWMTDPTAHPELAAGANGAAGANPGASPASSPGIAAAAASPAVAAAGGTPAAAPTTSASAVVAKATPAAPAAAASPAIAAGTAAKAPAYTVVTSPLPAAAAAASAAPAAMRPTPAPAVVAAAAKPLPSVSAAAVKPLPSPAATAAAPVVVAQAPALAPAASAEPAAAEAGESISPAPAEEAESENGWSASEVVRYLFLIIVIVQTAFVWTKVGMAFKRRNARRVARPSGYERTKAVEPDKVEAPR